MKTKRNGLTKHNCWKEQGTQLNQIYEEKSLYHVKILMR